MHPNVRSVGQRLFRSVPSLGKKLCIMKRQTWNGAKCLFAYHNINFYGLARGDYRTVCGKNVEKWIAPDDKAIARNARRVKRFMAEIRLEAS
jgi:hypothetical protein